MAFSNMNAAQIITYNDDIDDEENFDDFLDDKEISTERKCDLDKAVELFCKDPTGTDMVPCHEDEAHYVCRKFLEFITTTKDIHEVHADKVMLAAISCFSASGGQQYSLFNDFVIPVKSTVPHLSPQGRLYAYHFISNSSSSPDQFDTWPFYLERFEAETSDKIRATIFLFLLQCMEHRYGNEAKIEKVSKFCIDVISDEEKYGLLARFSAANVLSRKGTNPDFLPSINLLLNCVTDWPEYFDKWDAEQFNIIFNPDFPQVAANALSCANGTNKKVHIIPVLLEAIVTVKDDKMVPSIVYALLRVTFDQKRRANIYFDELEQAQKTVLKCLSEIPLAVEQEDIFAIFNIPSDIKAFINNPLPAEFQDPKKTECLDELGKVDWSKLEHAYGPASDLPKLVKSLASRDPQVRESVWEAMYAGPYHQGTTYTGTVAMIPFIIKLLDCPTVANKHQLANWLERVAIKWTSGGFSIKHFDLVEFRTKYFANANDEAEEAVMTNCYKEVEQGCSIYLSLLLDDQSSTLLKLAVVALLSRFPDFKQTSLPVLQEVYNNDKNPSNLRASVILVISHLSTTDIEIAKLKDKLTAVCDAQVTNVTKLGKDDLQLLVMEAMALGRLYLGPEATIPESVVRIVIQFQKSLNNQYDPTAFGKLESVVTSFLRQTRSQFTNDLISALPSVSGSAANSYVRALTATCFPEASGMTMMGGPSPSFFDLEINDEQAKLIDAIVECDAIWNLPKNDLKPIERHLHSILDLTHEPSRDSLRLSLQKRKNAQEK